MTGVSRRVSDVTRASSARTSASTTSRKIRSSWSSTFERWWVAILILPLMMSSDFKFRRRSAVSALGGTPDAQVLIEVGVYGLVAVYLVLARGKAPRLRRTTPIMFTMWFFASALAGSAVYAVYPTLAIVRGTQVLIVCAVAQTIASNATAKHMHRLAHAYLVMLCVAVALGHAIKLPVNPVVNSRFHWLYVHPVPGAIYLMIGSLIAFAYIRSKELREVLRLWPTWVYVGMAGWISLALVLTKTRGSMIGALAGVCVLMAFRTKTRTKLDVAAFCTATLIFIWFAFGDAIITYVERGQDISKLSTLNERTNLWALAFDVFYDKPIFGSGLGASRGIFLELIGLGGGHNAFVNVLVDAGLLGTIPFVALVLMIGTTLFRFPRNSPGGRDSLLLLPIFCGLLVNSITAEFMAVPANNASIWLYIFCGWIGVNRRATTSYLYSERGTRLTAVQRTVAPTSAPAAVSRVH